MCEQIGNLPPQVRKTPSTYGHIMVGDGQFQVTKLYQIQTVLKRAETWSLHS